MKRLLSAIAVAGALLVPATADAYTVNPDGTKRCAPLAKWTVEAGAGTSCSFARNVGRAIERKRQNYSLGNGATVFVRAWSPATRRYYRLRCLSAGSQFLCSGGNGAYVNVTFRGWR